MSLSAEMMLPMLPADADTDELLRLSEMILDLVAKRTVLEPLATESDPKSRSRAMGRLENLCDDIGDIIPGSVAGRVPATRALLSGLSLSPSGLMARACTVSSGRDRSYRQVLAILPNDQDSLDRALAPDGDGMFELDGVRSSKLSDNRRDILAGGCECPFFQDKNLVCKHLGAMAANLMEAIPSIREEDAIASHTGSAPSPGKPRGARKPKPSI